MNNQFTNKDLHIADKCIQGCATILGQEMQITIVVAVFLKIHWTDNNS